MSTDPRSLRALKTAADLVTLASIRIASALEIHRPCHTDATEPWGCEHGHADEACTTGIPDQPAVCVECTYDDRTVAYPCPTARALGAQPATQEDPS